MTPELMRRISRALQRGEPTPDERIALMQAAQELPAGATELEGDAAQLLLALEQRASQ